MYAGRRVLLVGLGVLGSELLRDLEAAVDRSPDEAREVLASLAHWPVSK